MRFLKAQFSEQHRFHILHESGCVFILHHFRLHFKKLSISSAHKIVFVQTGYENIVTKLIKAALAVFAIITKI